MDSNPETINPLELIYSFGYNTTLLSSVINLTTSTRTLIFYVSSNTGILLDYSTGKQHLLQGHCNPITSVCCSNDGRLIYTADSGLDSMIVIWDVLTYQPLATLLEPSKYGIQAMDITEDAAFIITLSAISPDEEEEQTIAVWDWGSGNKEPVAYSNIDKKYGYQKFIKFNNEDIRDIVTNSNTHVIFWVWTNNSIRAFPPNKKSFSKLTHSLGELSQSVFLPMGSRVITCTLNGDIILFDFPTNDPQSPDASARDALKIIKLVGRGGLKYISTIGQFIVTGGTDGAIRLFDLQFRVISWLESLDAGEISSISFQTRTGEEKPINTLKLLPQTTPEFLTAPEIPDCIVATTNGKILHVNAKFLQGSKTSILDGPKVLVRGFDSDVVALDYHPNQSKIAVGLSRGSIQLWDYETKKILLDFRFPLAHIPSSSTDEKSTKNMTNLERQKLKEAEAVNAQAERIALAEVTIKAMRFSPNGDELAVGFQNGCLRIFSFKQPKLPSATERPTSSNKTRASQHASNGKNVLETNLIPFTEIASFRNSVGAIQDVQFSHDGLSIATSDSDRCVALYRFQNRDEYRTKVIEWTYIGKNRAHSRKITSIYFGFLPAEKDPHFQYQLQLLQEQSDLINQQHQRAHFFHTRTGNTANEHENLNNAPKRIQSINTAFNVPGEFQVPVLLSVGEDRLLNRYDVYQATLHNGLKLSQPVDQSAIPLSVWLSNHYDENSDIDVPVYIVTSTSDYKFKLFEYLSSFIQINNPPSTNTDSATTAPAGPVQNIIPPSLKCVKICLSPICGNPIQKFTPVSAGICYHGDGKNTGTLAYTTDDKIIGLIKLPFDGNPNNSMSLIAHPGEVTAICSTYNKRYLLSAGGSDRSINLWKCSTTALHASSILAPSEIESYISLLDGGKDGEFYEQIVNYFYYAQLKAQGEITPIARSINDFINLDDVIPLVRALGYYPSQFQIQELYDEINTFLPNPNEISFDEFIKLYVNHRPIATVGKNDIAAAFDLICGKGNNESKVSREQFITKLLTKGEKMNEKELAVCLQALLGSGSLMEKFPTEFNADNFSFNVLGFQDYENNSE